MQNDQYSLEGYSPPTSSKANDDIALARRARGDPEVFAELYQRHMKQIYHFHLIRTGSVDDAQDLTSQTFLAALEGIGTYRGQGTFCGWLFGIASHKVIDHYRRRRTDEPLESADVVDRLDRSPEDIAMTHLQLAQVSDALQALASEQTEALTLRIFGELSAAEVGRIMGKSEAAVKMLVHRGLHKLQERLTLASEGLQ